MPEQVELAVGEGRVSSHELAEQFRVVEVAPAPIVGENEHASGVSRFRIYVIANFTFKVIEEICVNLNDLEKSKDLYGFDKTVGSQTLGFAAGGFKIETFESIE